MTMLKFATLFPLIFAAVCAKHLQPRIIDGTQADPDRFPYVVSIRTNNTHFCTGSIIAPFWVLTAAHCFEQECKNCGAENVTVVSNLVTEEPGAAVRKIVQHHEHDFPLRINDVALVELEEPLYPAGQEVRIKLGSVSDDSVVVVAGWGVESGKESEASAKLQYTTLRTTGSDELCENNDLSFCAITVHGGGTCNGDCGGPVVNEDEDTLVGIITHGRGECAPGHAESITRVDHFIDWIAEVIERDE